MIQKSLAISFCMGLLLGTQSIPTAQAAFHPHGSFHADVSAYHPKLIERNVTIPKAGMRLDSHAQEDIANRHPESILHETDSEEEAGVECGNPYGTGCN